MGRDKWMEKRKREWVTRQWDKQRGIETIDYNNSLVLVRAPVEDVAAYLARGAKTWEHDTLGREVVLDGAGAFVFRLQGHIWTEVLPDRSLDTYSALLKEDRLVAMSRQLETSVIGYYVSDTTGVTGYDFFEKGELIERFGAEDDGRSGPAPEATSFFSKRREVSVGDIKNIWSFTQRFFEEQDAFEPGIAFDYFFDHQEYHPGQPKRVTNPGFVCVFSGEHLLSRPPLERVDYIGLQ